MKKNLAKMMLAAMILCLALGSASIAAAQEDDAGDEFMLEEITVTAQKREENQQKVAIAMEVISGEDLVAMGKNDIDEILKDVASVEINQTVLGMRVGMRGLVDDGGTGNANNQQLSGAMVSINIDGSYNNQGNAGLGLYDVERVEVLMGPQSTMYGANSPGGIVNIITAAPKTDKYSASATVEYGSYDLLNIQGVLNVPVIQDVFALRLAASQNSQGSPLETDPDTDTTAVRLKALWDVYENLDVTITGNWSKSTGGGMMGGQVKPFETQDGYYTDGTKVEDPWTSNSDTSALANTDDQTTKGISGEINWSTPIGNVAIVPSYSESSSSGVHTTVSTDPMNPGTFTTASERSNEQTNYEVRMTNNESFELFDWIVGATYYESYQYSFRDDLDSDTNDEGQEAWQEKKALYANITYPLWFYDRLRLTLGYRQSWDSNHSIQYGGGQPGPGGNPDTESVPDLKYGFEYDVADNAMLYGSFSSSYRSQNAMAQQVDPDGDGVFEYPPNEELNSYSLGLKSRWLDNRLQVNLSAFYYDYENKYCSGFRDAYAAEDLWFDVDTISPVDPDTVQGRNDGYAEETDGDYPSLDVYDYDGDGLTDEDGDILEIYKTDRGAQGYGDFTSLGIDLSTTWILTSKDRLTLSVSYLDSEWSTLYFSFEYPRVFPDENYKNVTPANAPKFAITANYQHNFTLGALGTLTPRIDMKHKTEYDAVAEYDKNQDPNNYGYQEAYTTWDASAGFQHASGKWSLNAYVKNITDYAVKSQVRVGMQTEMRLSDPRTWGVTFSYKFF